MYNNVRINYDYHNQKKKQRDLCIYNLHFVYFNRLKIFDT